MKKYIKPWVHIFLVTIVASIVTIITTLSYFTQLLRAPKGTIFIGLTHYFEDYFYYLDQFYQGAHGGWLTYNNFTSEKLAPTLIYLPHILLGKIGGLFGLESYQSYNFSLIILKFLFILVSFFVISKIFISFKDRFFTFLIFIFSSSFIYYAQEKETSAFGTRDIWGLKNLSISRFGNIPYRYVSNLIFLGSLIFSVKLLSDLKSQDKNIKKVFLRIFLARQLPLSFFIVLLTLSDASVALIFLISYFIVGICNIPVQERKKYLWMYFFSLFVMGLSAILTALYLKSTVDTDMIYKNAVRWDIQEYFKQYYILKPYEFFMSLGSLGLLTLAGIILFIRKKKSILEQFVLVGFLLSVLGYLVPLFFSIDYPGFRFIFGSTYLFAAVISFYFLKSIEIISKRKILELLLVLYLLVNVNILRVSIMETTKPLNEPDYHFAYLPSDIYGGFLYIRSQNETGTVLANPVSSMDLLIPGLTGMKTYTGHFLMTYDAEDKDDEAFNFFFDKPKLGDGLKFVENNNIRFVVLTKYDGLVDKMKDHVGYLKRNYPFLKMVYDNDAINIFRVEK